MEPSLMDLPDPILATVISFLSNPGDLVACACTCKSLRAAALSSSPSIDVRLFHGSRGPLSLGKTAFSEEAVLSSPLKAVAAPDLPKPAVDTRIQAPAPGGPRIGSSPGDEASAHTSGTTPPESSSQAYVDGPAVQSMLQSIGRLSPLTQGLCIACSGASDTNVQQALRTLPRLASLVLDSCQKITAASAVSVACHVSASVRRQLLRLEQEHPHILALHGLLLGASLNITANWTHPSPGHAPPTPRPCSHLSSVSLRRCFRITPEALCLLVAAASAPDSTLQCILASHVDRLEQQGLWVFNQIVTRPSRSSAPPQAALPSSHSLASPVWAPSEDTAEGDAGPLLPRPGSLHPQGIRANSSGGSGAHSERPRTSRERVSRAVQGEASGALWKGLLVLVLHNCSHVSEAFLRKLALTCPNLEALFLGGSASSFGCRPMPPRTGGAPGAPVPPGLTGCQGLVSRGWTGEMLRAAEGVVCETAASLPSLVVLELTFFPDQLVVGIREALKEQCLVWNFTEEDSVREAATVLGFGWTREEASCSGEGAARRFRSALGSDFGSLEPILGSTSGGLRTRQSWGDLADGDSLDGDEAEDTAECFSRDGGTPGAYQAAKEGAPGRALGVGLAIGQGASPPSGFANPCEDLSGARDAEGDVPSVPAVGVPGPGLSAGAGLPGVGKRFQGGISRPQDMRAAVSAALQCSDFRRRTALHVAVERGDMGLLLALVRCAVGCSGGAGGQEGPGQSSNCGPAGAFVVHDVVNARDVQHTTPLFAAAEQGYTAAVEVLLSAGADITLSNKAGESPLYIASLKGHQRCVQAMLLHCMSAGVNWLDPSQYGDGWTPLMAAAVAERQEVAALLLESCGLGGERDRFVNAQNRYGQTALHVSARRGSLWFVHSLLEHGASCDVQDGRGQRASGVAQKHGHVEVAELLRSLEKAKAAPSGVKKERRKGKAKKAVEKLAELVQ